jgi:transcriptional regulator with XRE-family HTH domain
MDRLGEKIRRLREERGFTQAEVADACLVSRVAVTKWESGETENIKLGNLCRLCQKLQVDVIDLLGWKRSPEAGYRLVAEDRRRYATKEGADPEPVSALSAEEQRLLDLYRQALPQMRSAILASAVALAEHPVTPKGVGGRAAPPGKAGLKRTARKESAGNR